MSRKLLLICALLLLILWTSLLPLAEAQRILRVARQRS